MKNTRKNNFFGRNYKMPHGKAPQISTIIKYYSDDTIGVGCALCKKRISVMMFTKKIDATLFQKFLVEKGIVQFCMKHAKMIIDRKSKISELDDEEP